MVINFLQTVDCASLAASLAAASVLAAFAGSSLRLPGGVEMRGRAEDILNNTGKKFGSEISRSVLQRKIAQANLDISPEYFSGLRFALPVAGAVVFGLPALGGLVDYFFCALAAVLLYLAPGIWLNRKVRARVEAIRRDIPDFSILLGSALKGADLLTALEEVARTMKGELAGEIQRSLIDMATGESRASALNKMAARCGIPELAGLVGKIQQAMRYGSPLEPVVKHHAEKILARRKQETQKVAGELTIKLLFPIISFVLLPLFIFLGYPILYHILLAFRD